MHKKLRIVFLQLESKSHIYLNVCVSKLFFAETATTVHLYKYILPAFESYTLPETTHPNRTADGDWFKRLLAKETAG